MGTPAFAARSLQKLIDEGYEIPLVVTQPDRKGNRNKMVLSEVRKLAIGHGIETAEPSGRRSHGHTGRRSFEQGSGADREAEGDRSRHDSRGGFRPDPAEVRT